MKLPLMNNILLEDVYTKFSSLEVELNDRWNNLELNKKVDEFFKESGVPFEMNTKYAFLSRPIATPNKEVAYFIDLARSLNLKPVILEYHDKFVAKNKLKYFLCKLVFFDDENNILKYSEKVVDFNSDEGKNIDTITTTKKIGLIDLHRKLFLNEYSDMTDNVIDFTEWFNETRIKSDKYYLFFLSLFIRNGVLFENYVLSDKAESDFFTTKFYPSFKHAEEIFGVKPLIFPLLPIKEENNDEWLYYKSHIKDLL